MLCISCPFIPLKPLTLWMDHAKFLDVLTSLAICHAILPCAVCFATSSLANHATCSFIDLSGYSSGSIRRCLFIDYIIIVFVLKYIYIRTKVAMCYIIQLWWKTHEALFCEHSVALLPFHIKITWTSPYLILNVTGEWIILTSHELQSAIM